MRCLACDWKSRNVSNLSFCPGCGLADQFYYYKDDADDASDAMETCLTCNATYLYWRASSHKNFACG